MTKIPLDALLCIAKEGPAVSNFPINEAVTLWVKKYIHSFSHPFTCTAPYNTLAF